MALFENILHYKTRILEVVLDKSEVCEKVKKQKGTLHGESLRAELINDELVI